MGKIIKDGIDYGATVPHSKNLKYDNRNSGLESTNIQDAIDEVNSKTEVIDNLESIDIDKALSANMGRQLKAYIDNILITMLPIITEFTVTTGTGNGVGYAYVPVDADISRAVVTNIDRDDYFVSNVVKHGNDKLRLTVLERVNGTWADNITISGTMILYKEY